MLLLKRLDNQDKILLMRVRVLAPTDSPGNEASLGLPRPPLASLGLLSWIPGQKRPAQSLAGSLFVLFLWKVTVTDFRSGGFWLPSSGGSRPVPLGQGEGGREGGNKAATFVRRELGGGTGRAGKESRKEGGEGGADGKLLKAQGQEVLFLS